MTAALMDVTREQVSTLGDLVDLAESIERSISSMQAARDGVLALAGRWAAGVAGDADGADLSLRAVSAELAAALRVSDRTVQRRMLAAELLVERFPTVWAAQGAGRISAGHARVIVDAGSHIEDPVAREEYAARIVEFAEGESPNRVRPIAERWAQQYQPRSVDERHQDARDERGLWVTDRPDAMAELHVFGPSVLVHGVFDRITRMAKAHARVVKTAGADAARDGVNSACPDVAVPGSAFGPLAGSAFGPAATRAAAERVATDVRTLAQRRFDIAVDVLLTGAPGGHDTADGLLGALQPQVSITIPFLTLMGLDRAVLGAARAEAPPAELDGHGPIDARTARLLAGAASGWDRLLTHPVTGALVAADRYRPSEHLRRHLRSRDQRCRFPTCGMPAVDSDLDHTWDAALGGATEEGNLGALCRRHHVLKHQTPWQVEQRGGGLLEWTSPTGRVYVDIPPPQHTVTFADPGDDEPPSGGSGDPPDRWTASAGILEAPF